MLGNVNLETFLKGILTASQLKEIDTDGDGTLSSSELDAALFKYGAKSEDGMDTFTVTDRTELNDLQGSQAGSSGISSPSNTTANVPSTITAQGEGSYENSADARKAFVDVKDNFIENYIKSLGAVDAAEKKSVIAYLNQKSSAYITQYFKKNTQAPYDMSTIAADFSSVINGLLAQRSAIADENAAKISAYKENADSSYDKLSSTIEKASADYVTDKEFEEIKKQSVDYLMGQMLSGKDDIAFLTGLDKNYKSNALYKSALASISKLGTETDPIKKQELLANAESALSKLIGTKNEDGTSKITTAVNNKTIETKYNKNSSALDEIIDKMNETFSNAVNTTQNDVDVYTARIQNIKTAFLSEYDGDGSDLSAKFQEFHEKVINEWNEVSNEITRDVNKLVSGSTYEELRKACSSGKYMSKEEAANLQGVVADYVIQNLLDGKTDIALLSNKSSVYKNNAKFKEASSLIANLSLSSSPKEDYAKAKELISDMISNMSAQTIKDSFEIEESKNVNLKNNSTLTQGLFGYNTNETVGGDDIVFTQFTIENGTVKWTNSDDANDMAKITEQLTSRIQTTMKAQLGTLYNKEDIAAYINKAIIETAMNLDTTKGQKVSNVVDSIIANFDRIASNSLKGNKSLAEGVDKTSLLVDSGAINKYSDGQVTGTQYAKSSKAKNSVKNNAESRLEELREALNNQLKTLLGANYNDESAQRLISDAISKTVENYGYWNTKGKCEKYAYNAKDLYDQFINNVNSAVAQVKKDLGM